MRSKKGFTLVELIAVIAILAILVILALPNVINRFNEAKKQTFVTEAKKIYTEAGKKFMSSSISGSPVKVINSEDNSKLDMTGKKLQYCVILDNSGKVTDIKVSNGQWIASLVDGKEFEDLSIDDLTDGNLDGYNCSNNTSKPIKSLNCTFDGEMVKGAEFVNGQYTYRYMQEYGGTLHSIPLPDPDEEESTVTVVTYDWLDISNNGWGVILTDKDSTEAVKSDVCTTINNIPVVSMSYMFLDSRASSIDLSSFNTKNVVNMKGMFSGSWTTILEFNNFDTSNVTNMSDMFNGSKVSKLDLSRFTTKNVVNMGYMFSGSQATSIDLSSFDTSSVTDMSFMFEESQSKILDLSSFDTSKVIDMSYMFNQSKVKTIYVSNKFITNNVSTSNDMFLNSTDLVGGNETKYNASYIDKTYARIDGGTSNPGYFTLKQ